MPTADTSGRFLHFQTSAPAGIYWRTMSETGVTTAGGTRAPSSSAVLERSVVYPQFMIGLVQGGGSSLQSYPLASDGTVSAPQIGMVTGTNYSVMGQHPSLPVIYIVENAGAGIRVVDMSSSGTFALRGSVSATAASSIAVDPLGRYLLVANANAANNLSLYSLDTQGFPALHSSITAGGAAPAHIAFNSYGTHAYVARQTSGANLSTVKLSPFEVVATVSTGNTPGNGVKSLVVENSGRFLYVTGGTPSGLALMNISPVDGTVSSAVYYSFAVVPTIGLYHTTRCSILPDADC
jgi:6-phosphogluconolactonase (cycloisomerase 2 family)